MSNFYQVPEQYFFRLHHVRSRFKENIENVLFFFSNEIVQIGEKEIGEFKDEFDFSIKLFPGNVSSSPKTIANWRTEIDALFGFVKYEGGLAKPMRLAYDLSYNQDLVKFFKEFCYKFEYPNGGIKPQKVEEMLKARISFRPAPYIINLLKYAEDKTKTRYGINKSEATHCIFNDLRVTRDHRSVEETFELIELNKNNSMEYDWIGDVVRYAGDFLDYLCHAQLLVKHPNGRYYLNKTEGLAIDRFSSSTDASFNGYDHIDLNQSSAKIKTEIANVENVWIEHLNVPLNEGYFDTDILALYTNNEEARYEQIYEKMNSNIESALDDSKEVRIGDLGEGLVVNHEILNLVNNDRPDLKHLVKLIPSHYALGYDVSSRTIDDKNSMIEVKTTASNQEIVFSRFHLTPNEWKTADSLRENYYVYRLSVTPDRIKLHVINDPVGLYKTDKLKMNPDSKGGVSITFDPKKCGYSETLLLD